MPPTNSPLEILREAVKAVPAVRYALGTAGVAAAAAIGGSFFGGRTIPALLASAAMLALMILLVLFAKLTTLAGRRLVPAILVMTWSILLLVLASAGLLVSSLFFDWPKPIENVFAIDRSGSPPESNAFPPLSTPAVPARPPRSDGSTAVAPPPSSGNVPSREAPQASSTDSIQGRASAQGSRGSLDLYVDVFSAVDRNPIDGAEVTFRWRGGTERRYADSSGAIALRFASEPSDLTINVVAQGYYPQSRSLPQLAEAKRETFVLKPTAPPPGDSTAKGGSLPIPNELPLVPPSDGAVRTRPSPTDAAQARQLRDELLGLYKGLEIELDAHREGIRAVCEQESREAKAQSLVRELKSGAFGSSAWEKVRGRNTSPAIERYYERVRCLRGQAFDSNELRCRSNDVAMIQARAELECSPQGIQDAWTEAKTALMRLTVEANRDANKE